MTAGATPPLLALLSNSTLRKRLQVAVHSGSSNQVIGPVLFASDWQDLAESAKRNPGSPAVVSSIGATGDLSGTSAVAIHDGNWSATPLVLYGEERPAQPRADDLGLSFAARLRPDIDDHYDAIDNTILRCIDVRRCQRLLSRVEESAHPTAHMVFRRLIDLTVRPCAVPDLAAAVGLTERDLQRRCSAHYLPSPRVLVALARIFNVHRLAHWSRQPIGRVATALGFSGPSNYRRLVRQTLGAPPSVIESRGGIGFVEKVLLGRLGG